VYLKLRDQALRTTGATAGQSRGAPADQPFGVVTDLAFPNGSATVVAMIGGHASIYLSSGGGYIGGESHEAIRKAAKHAVAVASDLVARMHATHEYTLPSVNRLQFYVLSENGGSSTPEGARAREAASREPAL
jgi:hypothetical protein